MIVNLPTAAPAPDGGMTAVPDGPPAEGFAALIEAFVAATAAALPGAADGSGQPPAGDGSGPEGLPEAEVEAGVPIAIATAPTPGGEGRTPAPSAAPAALPIPPQTPAGVLPGCSCCVGAVGAPAGAPAAEPAVVERGTAPAPSPILTTPPEAPANAIGAPAPAVSAEGPAAPAPALTAQIVERVVEIVQRQQILTPPSTMVLELPGAAGARISVSLHAAGVHLAFAGMASSDVAPMLPQLAAGLAAHGMTLAGWSADAESGGGFDAPPRGDGQAGDGDEPQSFADYLV